jgi:hypothetical protein
MTSYLLSSIACRKDGWALLTATLTSRLRVTITDTTFEVSAGDSFVVRGGVEHQASALEDSLVIDVFTPFRDYV